MPLVLIRYGEHTFYCKFPYVYDAMFHMCKYISTERVGKQEQSFHCVPIYPSVDNPDTIITILVSYRGMEEGEEEEQLVYTVCTCTQDPKSSPSPNLVCLNPIIPNPNLNNLNVPNSN